MLRRRAEDEDPLAGLGASSVTSTSPSEESEEEDQFPAPPPSRENVLAALTIADDETDLDIAAYYVQRAIGESLLLLVDLLSARQPPPPVN